MTPPPAIRSCLVVGSGLIGTSIALALRAAGVTVYLADRDPVAVRRAADLGAGLTEHPPEQVELAVVAVSPSATAEVVCDLLASSAAATVVDTAGVKARVLEDVRREAGATPRFVGTHPMAGRERSGPGAARADLFTGRPWVVVDAEADHASRQRADALIAQCGGVAVRMTADDHDAAVALVSHVPQVAATLVAARLAAGGEESLVLTGQGLRDVTRVAASEPDLWADILTQNAVPVGHILNELRTDLDALIDSLEQLPRDAERSRARVRALLTTGNAGRARLPGKHGTAPTAYVVVPVVVADRPGELARLFADAGVAGINIEDVRIEHSPGQPVGLVELSVQPAVEQRLATALGKLGWVVHV